LYRQEQNAKRVEETRQATTRIEATNTEQNAKREEWKIGDKSGIEQNGTERKMSRKQKKHRGALAPDKYLSKEQVARLRWYLDTLRLGNGCSRFRSAVTVQLVDIMLNAGLRAGEVCNLQLRDLPDHHGKPVINIRDGKGDVSRAVDISTALVSRTCAFVKKYRRNAKPRSYLFMSEAGRPMRYWSVYGKVRIVGQRAGIGHLHPHKLRHTYGTMFWNATKDILHLQDQLGHGDPQTTAIYAKTCSDERRQNVNSFDL
jgi:site-specific recombinase XerD